MKAVKWRVAFILPLLLTTVLVASLRTPSVVEADTPAVVINEIMYHPASEVDNDEFLELYNTTGSPIDLTGWCFTAGITLCFSGVTIQAHDYVVVSPNSPQTLTTYGVVASANYTGVLSNGGETVTLRDASNTVVNSVTYDDVSPWPTSPDGSGPSLELRDPLLDNALAASWGASVGAPTPKAQNSLVSLDPPVLTNIVKPTNVSPSTSPTVTVTASNASVVELKYKVNFTAEQTVTMHDDGAHGDGASGDDVFGASIPTQLAGKLVRYRVSADNVSANATLPSSDESIDYYGYVVTDSSLTGSTPVLQWFIDDTDYTNLQAEDPDANVYYPTVVAYGDQVFDNAQVRLKGHYSATFPKKPYKFKLPAGYSLSMPGVLTTPLNEFHMNTDFADNRYITSLLSWRAFEYAGFPVPQVEKVQLQKNGAFEGSYTLAEKYDKEWLDRYPKYKTGLLHESFFEKVSPDDGDLTAITNWRDNLRNLNGDTLHNYLVDNDDIPNMINFMAVQAVIRNADWGGNQNNFTHQDSADTGRWSMLPWDFDLSFNAVGTPEANYQQGLGDMVDPTDIIPSLVSVSEDRFPAASIWRDPQLKELYKRRVRTLIDALYSDGRLLQYADQEFAKAEDASNLDYDKWFSYEDTNSYAPIRSIISGLGYDTSSQPVVNNYMNAAYGEGVLDILTDPVTAIEPLTPANRVAILKFQLQKQASLYTTNYQSRGVIPAAQVAQPRVIINELQYNPSGGQDLEYIELYNPSTEAVDISGWHIDAVGLTMPGGAVVPAQGYALVVKNDAAFRGYYGGGKLILAQYDGNLANEGENVTLTRTDNSVASQVAYGIAGDWPTAPNGSGPSLELIRASANETLAACWAPSTGGGSPAANNNPNSAWMAAHSGGCADSTNGSLANTGQNSQTVWLLAGGLIIVGGVLGLIVIRRR